MTADHRASWLLFFLMFDCLSVCVCVCVCDDCFDCDVNELSYCGPVYRTALNLNGISQVSKAS